MDRLGRNDDVVVMASPSSVAASLKTPASAPTTARPVPPSSSASRSPADTTAKPPSLTDLDDGNLKYTTDYRRIYSTLIEGWMG